MDNKIDRTIDYHAHILPGVDHGCHSVEMCAKQLDMAVKAGVKVIISTSHFYPQEERVEEFVKRRAEGLEQALPLAAERGITIVPCAETLWCPGIEKMEGLSELIAKEAGFNHLLLELPFVEFDSEKVTRTLKKIRQEHGCDILLAHVERYSFKDITQFDEPYVHYQINARSFKKPERWLKVHRYMKTGLVAAIGSDIHGLDDTYRYF